jgi:hypothetical protein
MKTIALSTLSVLILIAIALLSCKSPQAEKKIIDNNETVKTTEFEDSAYIWKTGVITMSPFITKFGEEIPENSQHYFLCSNGKYFIKLMNCKNVNADVKDFKNKYVKMKISIHDGLWDTNNPEHQSRIGPYVIYDSIVEIDEPIKIIYNDGNANAYIINTNNFKYNPVTPIESSSGTYSGDEPKDFEIINSQFNEIFIHAEQIVTNDKIKIDTRHMGTGFIKITFKNSEIKAYIDNCPELKEFQNYLNKIK